MFVVFALLLIVIPSLCAESQQYGFYKKVRGVQRVQVVKKNIELMQAVKAGNVKAVKKVLNNTNLHINELDADNKTTLDVAVEYQHKKIIVMLAKAGGKVTTMDNAEYVNHAVINSNICKHIVPIISRFFIGIILIVGAAIGSTIALIAALEIGSIALMSLGVFGGIALMYLGMLAVWSGQGLLSAIKNNHVAELYIL